MKNELDLRENLKRTRNFLAQASTLAFWRLHFANHRFRFEPKKFNWDYWMHIPLITKEEILKIQLENRLQDAQKIVRREPLRFILQSTSGTSKQTGPVLFLKNVDCLIDDESHDRWKRMLILYQGRAISLRDVIAAIRRELAERSGIDALVFNPFRFTSNMIEAISQFNADSTVTFPASVSYVTSSFRESRKIFRPIKNVFLSGDFLSKKQAVLTRKKFKKVTIDIDYIMTEVDSIGTCCKFLRALYGTNAYHPFAQRLVEIVNIDNRGFGEVVVTKMFPLELSFIRYRTGDVAHAVSEPCKCGNQWILFLEGRKNMDYVKGLGVLITRAEIDRVIHTLEKEIEEWRGEVREVEKNGALLGELTLLLKPRKKKMVQKHKLKSAISEKLFLTPRKTLATLVSEKKFMPLKIEFVDQFPMAAKNVLLKKILN